MTLFHNEFQSEREPIHRRRLMNPVLNKCSNLYLHISRNTEHSRSLCTLILFALILTICPIRVVVLVK